MCTNYTPEQLASLEKRWGVKVEEGYEPEAWPMFRAPIVLEGEQLTPSGDPPFIIKMAHFGLIPWWTKKSLDEVKKQRRNTNARSETIHELASFRDPWKRAQFALVPCEDIYEYYYGPDKANKKPVRWRIWRKDGEPFEVAAIYERWTEPETGRVIESYAMITINASHHPIMKQFHKPGDEERSVVIVPRDKHRDWLNATPETARDFLVDMPVDEFTSAPAPLIRGAKTADEPTLF